MYLLHRLVNARVLAAKEINICKKQNSYRKNENSAEFHSMAVRNVKDNSLGTLAELIKENENCTVVS